MVIRPQLNTNLEVVAHLEILGAQDYAHAPTAPSNFKLWAGLVLATPRIGLHITHHVHSLAKDALHWPSDLLWTGISTQITADS